MMGPGGAGRFQQPVVKENENEIPIMGPGSNRFAQPMKK